MELIQSEKELKEKINKHLVYNHNKASDSKFSVKASLIFQQNVNKPIKINELQNSFMEFKTNNN